MFNIVREFKPKLILELGTCLGVSAAYQGAAQVLNYNNGKLLTMEGAASLVEQSKSNLQSLGLINVEVIQGRFADNLERILNENKPIDYVFIDGHHDRIATIRYFEQILPYLSEKAIIIFDDISWSEGMKDAWNKIINHKCINLIVDMKTIGICFIDTKQEAKRIYNIR